MRLRISSCWYVEPTLTLGSRVNSLANDCGLGGCTCEKAADGGFNPANEIDFTTKK